MDAHLRQLQAALRGAPTLPVWCVCLGRGAQGTRDMLGQSCGHSTGYPAGWRGLPPCLAPSILSMGQREPGGSLLPGVQGRGCSPPQSLCLLSKAAPGRACCQRSYSWPSSAHLSALWESAVISSVIKGLGACSTSLKKQENNNDLCLGMLLSGVTTAFNAFQLRKLFMLQP